jgi:hypothetical protein
MPQNAAKPGTIGRCRTSQVSFSWRERDHDNKPNPRNSSSFFHVASSFFDVADVASLAGLGDAP